MSLMRDDLVESVEGEKHFTNNFALLPAGNSRPLFENKKKFCIQSALTTLCAALKGSKKLLLEARFVPNFDLLSIESSQETSPEF